MHEKLLEIEKSKLETPPGKRAEIRRKEIIESDTERVEFQAIASNQLRKTFENFEEESSPNL